MQDRAANANARARVSKDEDKQVHSPSCFETHRRAVSAVEGRGPAWRCGAPQHEGRRGRILKTSAHESSLFPACSLQGRLQLESVSG